MTFTHLLTRPQRRRLAVDFSEAQPETLLNPEWQSEYEYELEAIWWQIVRLNSNLFILRKISSFPYRLFSPFENPFWKSVYEGLFEASVMIIWRIALDTGRDALNITQLKNEIRENMQHDELRGRLDSELKKIGFAKGLMDVEDKVRDLRHNYIAHFSRNWNIDPRPDWARERTIRLAELREACQLVNSLFQLLCFGHGRGVLPIQYDPSVRHPEGTDARPDIVRILDSLARDSALLNMPEEQPGYWPVYRQQLSQNDLRELHDYRRRFGLPNS